MLDVLRELAKHRGFSDKLGREAAWTRAEAKLRPEPTPCSVFITEWCHAKVMEGGEFFAGTDRQRRLTFTPQNYHRLARLFIALDTIHKLNVRGRTATQRELFYRAAAEGDGGLFKQQIQMDSAMRDAVGLLRIGRSHLGVLTTEKGLVAGALRLRPGHGAEAGAAMRSGAGVAISEMLVGAKDEDLSIDPGVKCVLVVEKDTFFRHLLRGHLLAAIPMVLVTGRGYPDQLTRRLLQRLQRTAPELPQVYLGDFDPDGVNIYATYRSSCSSLKWLGLHHEDTLQFPPEVALPLTPRDEVLRVTLLRRMESIGDSACASQVRLMSKKFELEALHTVYGPDGVATRFLPEKLLRRGWI